MRERIRNWASIVVAGLCLALAVPALFATQPVTGITLGFEGSVLVVTAVDPDYHIGSDVGPGMIVYEVNGVPVEDVPAKEMEAFLKGYFSEVGVVHPTFGNMVWSLPPDVVGAPPPEFVFFVGVGLLFGIAIWVMRGQAGEALRPLALPLATATAVSFILRPAWSILDWPAVVVGILLSALPLLALADGFIERVTHPTRRRVAAAIAVAVSIASVAVAIGELAAGSTEVPLPHMSSPPGLPGPLAAAITLVPATMLLASSDLRSSDRIPIFLGALTPTVVATTYGLTFLGLGLALPLFWLLLVVFVLQSNARVETLRIQRDTVVAATEVERARLAADLHDDALQEMTVLVRRLDDGGDKRAAELARSIADRLREVCGDLRLPVLDELGAGPALEWLVARVGETSGHQVRLERHDDARPPAAVELAVFRVAQEALANAVAHGAPPVVVRYAAASDRATLSITDQGPGIPADAPALAPRSGHYGLLNMRQRAEQIGARIDVRRPPDGGTVIGLTWASS